MSIINNANPGSDFKLIALVDRLLLRNKKPRTIEQLVKDCCPDNLPLNANSEGKLQENIRFWADLGLWKQTEEGLYPTDNPLGHDSLPRRMLGILFRRYRDQSVMTGNDGEPLLRNAVLMLVHAPLTLNDSKPVMNNMVEGFVKEHWPTETMNSNVKGTLLGYLEFLGVLEKIDAKSYCVDPTRAILPWLPQVFKQQQRLSITEFLANLAELMPIVDGGAMRQEVELSLPKIKTLPPHQLSASLSNALWRLDRNRTINLIEKSDDPDAKVIDSAAIARRSISAVEFIQGAVQWS
ncbi:protein DpdG [Ferrimonas senticii]|uniref:protein DpdG n=1 Tax=Ferrimonas senticii TaxID=394566 RepID=UPI0004299D84|nr:protein DpdG [Ferrimonas senticii]